MKVEILLFYYKRPRIVKNALESINKLNYKDWHLTFIDDSGNEEFKNELFSFGLDNKKVTYVPVNMSDQQKKILGGSVFGSFANEAIFKSDADILVPLCDDDALLPNYLNDLSSFYAQNPEVPWAYCHVKYFNPNEEHYSSATITPNLQVNSSVNLNAHNTAIHPSCRVDSSQVSFRMSSIENKKDFYPSPQTKDLDRSAFEKFYVSAGPCYFCGCFGQYKGWFEDQLGARYKLTGEDYI